MKNKLNTERLPRARRARKAYKVNTDKPRKEGKIEAEWHARIDTAAARLKDADESLKKAHARRDKAAVTRCIVTIIKHTQELAHASGVPHPDVYLEKLATTLVKKHRIK